jgi:menaquinone-dependent protoporphyrinogen IX oxidase
MTLGREGISIIGKFAGFLNYSKMSFVQRTFARNIFLILGIEEDDYSDWVAMEYWAKSLLLEKCKE